MKKILFIFWFVSLCSWAYTPDAIFLSRTEQIAEKMNRSIEKMPQKSQSSFIQNAGEKITELQNHLIQDLQIADKNRLYLLEYLRRNILHVASFSSPEVIYDELDSVIWNHASRGFDVLYTPFETPSVEKTDSTKKYSVLLNGGYFNRIDGALYHAWIFAMNGQRYTPFVSDNPQLTHNVCVQDGGYIQIIPNKDYQESLITSCRFLFQVGPLVYSRTPSSTQENTMSNSYIGRAHKRTVMVLFEKEKKQDVWFLTINENVTLKEVRNIVLRETRFIDWYDSVYVLNLDGGSSVAHINRNHPELNIGRTKVLPVVFGIY